MNSHVLAQTVASSNFVDDVANQDQKGSCQCQEAGCEGGRKGETHCEKREEGGEDNCKEREEAGEASRGKGKAGAGKSETHREEGAEGSDGGIEQVDQALEAGREKGEEAECGSSEEI